MIFMYIQTTMRTLLTVRGILCCAQGHWRSSHKSFDWMMISLPVNHSCTKNNRRIDQLWLIVCCMSPLTLFYSFFPPSIHLSRVDTYNHSHTRTEEGHTKHTKRDAILPGGLSPGSSLQRHPHVSTVHYEVYLSGWINCHIYNGGY